MDVTVIKSYMSFQNLLLPTEMWFMPLPETRWVFVIVSMPNQIWWYRGYMASEDRS